MKFWANLDNWAKYGLKAVQIVSGGIEQGKTLREEYDSSISNTQFRNLTPREKEYFLTHPNQDSLGLKKGLDTLLRYNHTLPLIKHFNCNLYHVGVDRPEDTIVRKSDVQSVRELIKQRNRINKEKANENFEKGDY
ncbi:hypothetical protein [Maribacter luteus]|uniref:hypothetical protein n=1 Tax=Maribacter luteus TaxID=2594478 RepID=UPI002492731B|nr:hypothetical protein [Maribacter luteus]